jgi:inner membrane protein
MASIGHVMVGLAAARLARRGQPTTWSPVTAAVIWSGLSLAPDADVIGFRLGVHYADPWGHRGATHSFAFALALGATAWLIARLAKLPAARTGLLVTAVVASHALFDTLTDGGLGCALLWPVSNARFFAPWTPLPVAPIGRAFLSAEGVRIALIEAVAFSPFLAYAAWPAAPRVSAAKRPPE